MILIIFIAAVILKLVFMASIELILGIIALLIIIPIGIWFTNLLDQITFKSASKIAAWGSVLYGLSWCWNALPG